MNIMWHTWEPGLDGNHTTSGGGGMWTKFLFEKFKEVGHYVYWFTSKVPTEIKEWTPTFPVDVAVFCWRWELPNLPQYEDRNNARDRQNFLISWCMKNHIPFLVHDQDMKMTFEEVDWIMGNGGIIATPSFFPRYGEISLHYPNPFKFEKIDFSQQKRRLVYIGNNYERLEQTIRMLEPFSNEEEAVVYGNWTESGPGRNPLTVTSMMPNVMFQGRLPQTEVMNTLRKSKATILLHKPEYGKLGFVTIRWAEAAAAGILPFIPREFELPAELERWLDKLRVSNGNELLDQFRYAAPIMDEILIDRFRQVVDTYMRPEPWITQLERMHNDHVLTKRPADAN